MGTAHRPTSRTTTSTRTTRGTTRGTTRAAVAVGAALLAAGALGACSSSGGTGQTAAQAPVTQTVTSTAPTTIPPTESSTTASGSGAATGTTTTSSGGAEAPGGGSTAASSVCQPSQLTLRVDAPEGGGSAGHVALQLIATNKSSSVCTTQGYPGISLVAPGTGQQLGAPADRATGQSAPLLRLEPGKSAVATIQVAQAGNFPNCGETTASGFRVYLPGTTAAAYVPYPVQACATVSTHQLQVQPFNA